MNRHSPRVQKWLSRVGLVVGGTMLAVQTGCARPYGVPPTSQLVAESPRGEAATFQAPDEGTVYVDGPGNGAPGRPRHIVYSGLVTRGQMVTIDSDTGRLLVDNKPVDATLNLGRNSFYQIWFQPSRHDLLAP